MSRDFPRLARSTSSPSDGGPREVKAAAQADFAARTGAAGLRAVVPPPSPRPLSEIFVERFQSHIREVKSRHARSFTGATALAGPLTFVEDEELRLLFRPDRPGGRAVSLERCWSD